MMKDQSPFIIGAFKTPSGTRRTVDLPVSVLSDHTPVTMSVHVIHGRRPGPTLFISAAIHGDEIIGVEIARRLLRAPQLDRIKGTLLVIPIVNSIGFLNHSRYLPDRRDLNRSFPGTDRGSLASRLAHLFRKEIVERANFGIDLNSAAVHRINMPQIRVSALQEKTMELAKAFGAPVIIKSKLREGSLRQFAQTLGVDMLLYEAGEGLRFDELSAHVGVSGILRVMAALEMTPPKRATKTMRNSVLSSSSSWLRAPAGGLMRSFKRTGESVTKGDVLGIVSDPFGEREFEITAETTDVIIGRTNLPMINEGDALFHIAIPDSEPSSAIEKHITEHNNAEPMFDEDEII